MELRLNLMVEALHESLQNVELRQTSFEGGSRNRGVLRQATDAGIGCLAATGQFN